MAEPVYSPTMARLLRRGDGWARLAPRARALPAEEAPLEDAVGRILATDVACPIDIPSFDRSAMDGYALRAADTPGALTVAGEVAAGDAGDAPLEPGTARRIFTGGAIPPGADAVEKQELVQAADDGTITVDHPVAPAENVRF